MLPGLKEELCTLLKEGLPMYPTKPYSEEMIATLLTTFNEQTDNTEREKILVQILTPRIDCRFALVLWKDGLLFGL